MTALSANELQLLANTAIAAARQAGAILVQQANSPVSAQYKKGGESLASQVLTETDLLCQEAILKILLPSCEQFDLALLSEETDDDKQRLYKDYFWCVDPLDGTLPFIESTPGYAVSIALVSRSGQALIGVIYDPVKQTLYHAVKDSGAFRNEQPWSLPSPSSTSRQTLTIVSDRSFVQLKYYTEIMQQLEIIAEQLGCASLNTIQYGGAAMNACWVLENTPACYFKFPKPHNGGGSLWDYAASSCLFNELAAIVSDIHGNPLELNRADSTFMNHQGIIFASSQIIAEQIIKLYSIGV